MVPGGRLSALVERVGIARIINRISPMANILLLGTNGKGVRESIKEPFG